MKQFIKNQNNEDLCVQVFAPLANTKYSKLAIICHGITGYKEQDVILQTAKTLSHSDYSVITFDCRNSRGESHNNHSCATLSSMYDDIQTIIEWAKNQDFYVEPFLLAGHSLGGSVVLNYAELHPQNVSHLILISSVFDGNKLLQNTKVNAPEFFQQLQNGGVIRARNKTDCYLDSTYLYDFIKHDLYKNIQELKMPVLMISGDNDTASTFKNNERFYQSLNGKKELHILQHCSHIYDTTQNLSELNNKIEQFLSKK